MIPLRFSLPTAILWQVWRLLPERPRHSSQVGCKLNRIARIGQHDLCDVWSEGDMECCEQGKGQNTEGTR